MSIQTRNKVSVEFNMASLTDIVFLLLVFFMLTSTFLVPEAVELELPESKSANVTEITPIIISLNQTGKLALNGESITLEQLQQAIKPLITQNVEAAITLKSDARTEVQLRLEVMDEIRAAGGTNVGLATMQK